MIRIPAPAFALLGVALLTVLSSATDSQAGAWVQAPGKSFVKASLISQRAEDRWSCRGSTEAADPDGAFVQQQLFAYGEYGWLNRLSLVGSWAWKDQRIDGSPSYGTRSSGDLRLGARYGLVQGPRALALEGHLSVPTYPASDLQQSPALRRQYLPAGSGKVEGEIHLVSGISLYPAPLYANLDVGYRARAGRFGNQFTGSLEVGGSSPRFFAKTELRWMLPEHERCDEGSVGSVSFTERSVQLAPEVAVRFTETLWVSAGLTQPLSGRNSLDGLQWTLGLMRWKQG